ncbi:MAG: diphosphatase [Hyphomicrobiales bacterium]|nr:diphosphatase [Hyphomicrobiales bacterium]
MSIPEQPPADASALTGYGVNALDRLAARRDDSTFVADLAGAPGTRHLVFHGDMPLLRRRSEAYDPYFLPHEAHGLGTLRETVLLGRDTEGGLFGSLLDAPAAESGEGAQETLAMDLRSIAQQGLLPPPLLGALAEAKSLLYWHARHRFCPNCGAATRLAASGWRRECDSCEAQHFPRTDPVVIMLIVDGESCLLGRQARFPSGMYSALAGFVEPGETIEAAVRREIAEESGIVVGRVAYHASQPWPFPATLMIGCFGEALSRDVVVDRTELEDARWFSRAEAQAMFEGRHENGLLAPSRLAIAWHLLRAFAEGREPSFAEGQARASGR